MGVFETMLVRERRVQALELHLERLRRAVDRLYGSALPEDLRERVRAPAADLVAPHRLRIDAIPQGAGLHIEILATPVAAVESRIDTVKLKPVLIPGGIGEYKWRDRRVLDVLEHDGSIPLILDAHQEVLEASRMNVWLVEGRRIVTPPADGRLLPGVTRTLLLDLAAELDLDAAAEPITLDRARSADAIFLTSSIRRVTPATLRNRAGAGSKSSAIERIHEALDGAQWG